MRCALTVKENQMSTAINLAPASSDSGCNTVDAASKENLKIALPRPIRSVPSTADTGRITFGAGYRLPTRK